MTPAERITVFLLDLLSGACHASLSMMKVRTAHELGQANALAAFGYYLACEAESIEFR